MISRKAGVVFLFALALGVGIWTWDAWHPDACYRYLRGDAKEDATQTIEVGGEPVSVPCDQWLVRQNEYVQGAVLAEGTAGIALVLLLIGDFINWRRVKVGRARLEE